MRLLKMLSNKLGFGIGRTIVLIWILLVFLTGIILSIFTEFDRLDLLSMVMIGPVIVYAVYKCA